MSPEEQSDKKRVFDINLSLRQTMAMDALEDPKVTECLYGGAKKVEARPSLSVSTLLNTPDGLLIIARLSRLHGTLSLSGGLAGYGQSTLRAPR
jgi:hypothetical protein